MCCCKWKIERQLNASLFERACRRRNKAKNLTRKKLYSCQRSRGLKPRLEVMSETLRGSLFMNTAVDVAVFIPGITSRKTRESVLSKMYAASRTWQTRLPRTDVERSVSWFCFLLKGFKPLCCLLIHPEERLVLFHLNQHPNSPFRNKKKKRGVEWIYTPLPFPVRLKYPSVGRGTNEGPCRDKDPATRFSPRRGARVISLDPGTCK